MALVAGARVGPYEIVSAIGAGGMGEVYRAKDTRLDRIVAVKVLSEAVAGDPQFRERFDREARAISQLTHPHICTLYDVGHQDGIDYLVLEYLEGETLAERLEKGALPLEQALRYAIEVGEALDKAHRQGVVHRDLKPGNVFLTKSGAKVLDFGLAKSVPLGAAGGGVSIVPTVEKAITAQGTILGTLQYMAPEQLEGRDADARSDIFALGTLVYEMATGKKAFEGRSQASLIAAILERQPPPISAQQAIAPPALDHVVQCCLAKDPEQRWLTAHDVVLELKWIAERLGVGEPTPAARPKGTREAIAWALVVLLMAGLGGAFVFNSQRAPTAVSPSRLTMTLSGTDPLNVSGLPGMMAISPNGRLVAYATWEGNRFAGLRVRPLNGFESTVLAGTEDARQPFFSPDGQWIGFFANGQLKKAAVGGGVVLPIVDFPGAVGQGLWTPDGSIIFPSDSGMLSVPASGGAPRALIPSDPKANRLIWGSPALLPDGHTLVFSERAGTTSNNDARIVAYDIKTGARKTIVEGGFSPQYVRTGHLVFTRAGSLVAVPFDASRLAVTGPPQPVLQGVMTTTSSFGWVQAAISAEGTLVYLPTSGTMAQVQLVWVDRNGGAHAALPLWRRFEHPRLSPDARRVAVDIRESNVDVWVGDLTRGTLERLTFDPREDESPIWHPDGTRITFAGTRDSGRVTLLKSADGSGEEATLFNHQGAHQHLGSWSPDGRVLALTVTSSAASGNFDILTITTGDHPSMRPFVKTPFSEQAPMFSPDGKWIAYMSDESGRTEIYVQPFPGPGGKRQVSTEGGFEPAWNPNGHELFYRAGNRMMAVPVTLTPTFSAEAPRVLFEGRFDKIGWGERDYDVAPDGQRFLMISAPEDSSRAELNVVLNWQEELKQRVPVK